MSRVPKKWFISSMGSLFIWTCLLTIIIGFIIVRIETSYFQNYSYFFDPVGLSYENAKLYLGLATEGRFALAVQEWLGNNTNPLRTVPLLLFAPHLLASNVGHMGTVLPMLFIFLWLLGWTVARRTGCIPYAIACMFLFCAIPGLFNPIFGLGSYWLDLPAALLVGGAALCLLNSSGAQSLKWLAGFAVLASLATLSRYVAAAFAFVVCGPVLASYLVQRWRREGNVVKSVLLPLGLVSIVTSLLAGYYLLANLQSNAHYYSTYGYALNLDWLLSARSVIDFLVQYCIEIPAIFLLGAIFVVNLILFRKEITQNWENLLITTWYGSAVMLFLIFGLRTVGATTTMYVVPLLFFAAVSPFPISKRWSNSRVLISLSGLLIVTALVFGGSATINNYYMATHPSPDDQDQKAIDVAIAQALSKEGDSVAWNTYFDEYAFIPTMETFYRYGKLPVPMNNLFTVHEAYWLGFYPGIPENKLSEHIYTETTRLLDVAVVFDQPKLAETNTAWQADPSPKTRLIAKYVAERIRNDPNWSRLFVIKSKLYGTLAGYRNLTRNSQGGSPLPLLRKQKN